VIEDLLLDTANKGPRVESAGARVHTQGVHYSYSGPQPLTSSSTTGGGDRTNTEHRECPPADSRDVLPVIFDEIQIKFKSFQPARRHSPESGHPVWENRLARPSSLPDLRRRTTQPRHSSSVSRSSWLTRPTTPPRRPTRSRSSRPQTETVHSNASVVLEEVECRTGSCALQHCRITWSLMLKPDSRAERH
jgi:hypothetical protein